MQNTITSWGIAVKSRLIELDWSVNDLAKKIGKSRENTSAVINGRLDSPPIVSAINEALGVTATAKSMREITKNWQKKAKIELVKKGMNMKDLAKATGYSVEYLNSIVNGRVFSAQAIKAVNRELGINEEETMRFL